MKIFKRFMGVFFIVVAFAGGGALFAACEVPKPNNSSIFAEEKTENTNEENKNLVEEKQDVQENEEQIFFTEISIHEEYILVNNGVGINFDLKFFPIDASESINIEIEDESIVNFGENLSLEQQIKVVNFTSLGNFIYPLEVGETEILITAPKSETENLIVKCKIIVVEDEKKLGVEISDINGKHIDKFMSGIKANGEREYYQAKISSIKSLENRLNIPNLENFVLDESSVAYYKEDDNFFCKFNFYLEVEKSYSLQFSAKEEYANLNTTIYSEEISLSSKNYIKGLDVRLSGLNGGSAVIIDGDYIMYLTDVELMEEANLNNFFNKYRLTAFDLDGNEFGNFEIILQQNSVIEVVNQIGSIIVSAKGFGNTEIIIKALDGSGYVQKVKFIVQKIEPTSLKIGNVDILSDFDISDLESEIGREVSIYGINDLGKKDFFSLSISIDNVFVSSSYAYFEGSEGLIISESETKNKDGKVKTFTFKAENEGRYTVDFIVNGQKLYSFTIHVLEWENYFEFSTRDTDVNVEYSFNEEPKTITILDLAGFKGKLVFKYLVVDCNGEEQDQDLIVEYDTAICDVVITAKQIYIEKFVSGYKGTFTLKITEANSGISEEIIIIVL